MTATLDDITEQNILAKPGHPQNIEGKKLWKICLNTEVCGHLAGIHSYLRRGFCSHLKPSTAHHQFLFILALPEQRKNSCAER